MNVCVLAGRDCRMFRVQAACLFKRWECVHTLSFKPFSFKAVLSSFTVYFSKGFDGSIMLCFENFVLLQKSGGIWETDLKGL